MTTEDQRHLIIDALHAWVERCEEFAPYASMITLEMWEERARGGQILSWKLAYGEGRYMTENLFVGDYRLSLQNSAAALIHALSIESTGSLRKLISAAVLYGHAQGLELIRETQAAIAAADEAFE